MGKPYSPEMGQAAFGREWAQHELPEIGEACFWFVVKEIERVKWNRDQKVWDAAGGADHMGEILPGVIWWLYWWGEDDAAEAKRPNFSANGVEIRWYKHPGRGMSTTVDWDGNRWAVWLDVTLAQIRGHDVM